MNQPDIGTPVKFGESELTSCDREQIHIPGRVQNFGALIAMTTDRIIQHASVNIDTVFGLSAQELIGKPFSELASNAFVHEFLGRLQTLTKPDGIERMFRRQLTEGGEFFDVAIHSSGSAIIVECEPVEAGKRADLVEYVRPMIERVTKATNIADLSRMAARQVKALTGYDRVMVYRFDENGNGKVIAEALNPDLEPFLGLNYPASDIPKQARALYLRNMLRVIGDVNDAGIEIVPTLNPHGEPLDLSLSTTRAVSPIHLEYLRNMGVGGSMSVSIIRQGKLWGLIACHHGTPLVPSYPVRTAAEFFAELFSFVLERKENEAERQDFLNARELHDRIMVQLATDTSVSDNFDMILEATQDVIPFTGAVGWVDGTYRAQGIVPTEAEFRELLPFLNSSTTSRVLATNCLGSRVPAAAAFADRAAGLLSLPVSRVPRDYIVFFRQEESLTVTWAGDPDKAMTSDDAGIRLSPRKSFEAWKQDVAGHSVPWTDDHIRAADALRVTLMEVVLRLTEASLRHRAKAQEKQELLIAELNHRVRNILNLIKGLVSQSAEGQESVTALTGVIGGRVDALARAHDQITREHWAPASLYTLIKTESNAYLAAGSDRIVIDGPDAMIKPDAFTTLALVFHELVTNSAKYGALCDSRGKVTILTSRLPDGSLKLEWRESGGPPVQATKRRGFGTTIIERSIPFELQGTASVKFEVTGLEAEFTVPPMHVDEFRDKSESVREEATAKAAAKEISRTLGNVLVVEDNMIIALDAEVFLEQLGATKVSLTSSVAQALALLETVDFGFALLDVNLGAETSVPVAEALTARGIPFIFATGYGDTTTLVRQYPKVTTIQKPYNISELREALS